MKVTIRVHGCHRPGFSAWIQALDSETQEKVPFDSGERDICLTSGIEDGVCTVEVPDSADIVVYEAKDADASEQEAYLRGQQA